MRQRLCSRRCPCCWPCALPPRACRWCIGGTHRRAVLSSWLLGRLLLDRLLLAFICSGTCTRCCRRCRPARVHHRAAGGHPGWVFNTHRVRTGAAHESERSSNPRVRRVPAAAGAAAGGGLLACPVVEGPQVAMICLECRGCKATEPASQRRAGRCAPGRPCT